VLQAVEYYKKAASLGHVQASYNLGVYYAQGRGGLPKDPSRAHQLFEHAASQGSLQAKAAISSINEPEAAAHNPSASWLPVVVGT
jgi:TPR repeat protein